VIRGPWGATLASRAACLAFAALAAGCASNRQSGPAPVVDRTGRPAAMAAQPASQPTAADGFYIVKRGDTLYSIALEHGADYREVAQWNNLSDPTKISVGQQLRVKAPPERVQVGTAKGAGRPEARALDAPAPSSNAAAPPAAAAAAAGTLDFIWPAKGKVIAGFAEPRSKGIDIDGKLGDPIVAAASGRVTYIGTGIPGLGKLIVIKHENGFITVYAHNKEIVVKEQQNVARGQKIAELGATDADRPKLHFQIRKGSAPVDPLRYLPAS
jgi:lipoprotein NlpD